MISMRDQMCEIAGSKWTIERFEVWFKTPIGLVDNVAQAITICEERDLDPDACVLPVCVALGPEDHQYEVMV